VDVFVLIEDESLRAPSLQLVQALRNAGFAVDFPLTAAKSDKQFKRAQELRATWTARMENAAHVRLRHLGARREMTVPANEAAAALRAG
jgi:histidyl-tRNA synthetase